MLDRIPTMAAGAGVLALDVDGTTIEIDVEAL
jgi:hypothetical protein